MEHALNPALYTDVIRVRVIGCGGTGGAVASQLPFLHRTLLAQGHRGLDVTLMDGDVITEANCARQPYAESEVGHPKSVIIANRTNGFHRTRWHAEPRHFTEHDSLHTTDLLISCVDSRGARKIIADAANRSDSAVAYWLDLGNTASGGQWLLGEPLSRVNPASDTRLPTVAELFPEITTPQESDDDLPSCSAAEALNRQEPFVNPALAIQALALLGQLFRHGTVTYHGAFWNLLTGNANAIRVDPAVWAQMRARALV